MAEEENHSKQLKSMADFFPHLRLRTSIDPSMEALPAELTIDILSRLPVKTIIHCKLVCKKWRSLVLDSSFVNLHLSRSPTGIIIHHNPRINMQQMFANWNLPNDPGILNLVEIENKVDHHLLHHNLTLDLNLTPILQNSRIHHMGSVNGLIILWQYSPKLDNTYICNPITREYMILPRQRYYRQGIAIISYGFGVSSRTGEYKVVRTFQWNLLPIGDKPSRMSMIEAEVYTLGTGCWRSLGSVPYWLNGFRFYGPFLNNHCHWIVVDQEDLCTFDLDKETFQLFPSPPPEPVQKGRFHHQNLAVLKGCLCKLDTYDSELMIWVMKEYGIKKSWQKDVVIKHGVSYDLGWPLLEPSSLIVGLKDGSILIVFEGKLWAFHPRSERMEDTKMFDPNLSGMAYRPSFLKLKSFESERVNMF